MAGRCTIPATGTRTGTATEGSSFRVGLRRDPNIRPRPSSVPLGRLDVRRAGPRHVSPGSGRVAERTPRPSQPRPGETCRDCGCGRRDGSRRGVEPVDRRDDGAGTSRHGTSPFPVRPNSAERISRMIFRSGSKPVDRRPGSNMRRRPFRFGKSVPTSLVGLVDLWCQGLGASPSSAHRDLAVTARCVGGTINLWTDLGPDARQAVELAIEASERFERDRGTPAGCWSHQAAMQQIHRMCVYLHEAAPSVYARRLKLPW